MAPRDRAKLLFETQGALGQTHKQSTKSLNQATDQELSGHYVCMDKSDIIDIAPHIGARKDFAKVMPEYLLDVCFGATRHGKSQYCRHITKEETKLGFFDC